ncbi:MAG: type II toxin-antitoxin system death-on-curing family toxin [Pseudomonadota bacterium]
MKEPNWLLKQTVLAVHNQLVLEFGGGSGIRDEGLLESALDRPLNVYQYDDSADLHSLAAAYTGGIVQNHPFVDGNKRTGFICAYMFLARNGLRLDADQITATAMTLALAASDADEAEYAAWLRDNAKTID